MEPSIVEPNTGTPVGRVRPTEGKTKASAKERFTAAICLLTFVGAAAATLIICGLTPPRPIPEGWHRIVVNRTNSVVRGKPNST